MQEEQQRQVLEQVKQGVTRKIEEITTKDLSIEDLWKTIETTDLLKRKQVLQAKDVTETEKNRFNSKFEFLGGEGLKSEKILNIIEAIKDNFIEIEVVSNSQIKLKLSRLDKNEEVTTTLKNFIEQNKDKTYNVTVEYDKTTGLVSDLLVSIFDK